MALLCWLPVIFLKMPRLPKGTKSGLGNVEHTGYSHRLDPTCWKTALHKGKAGNWPGWQKDESRTVPAPSMGTGMLCGSRLNSHWLGRGSRAASPGIQVSQAMKAPLSSWASWTHAPALLQTLLTLSRLEWERLCSLWAATTSSKETGKDWATCAFITFHVGLPRNMGSPQNR